jgi:hypothetical protein
LANNSGHQQKRSALENKFMNKVRSIWIITEQRENGRTKGSRSNEDIGGRLKPTELIETSAQIRTTVPVETLKKEMEAFLSDIGEIFSHAEKKLEQEKTEIQLDEIGLSIEISVEGQISLLGIGGKTGSKGSISLKFKRKGTD